MSTSDVLPQRRLVFPPMKWLSEYGVSGMKSDLLAGMTLAAYAIPVSMGYATLAGVPPHHGIYCYLLAGVFYAVLGTSRQLAIGPTAAISLLVGSTVGVMANGDPSRWMEIAALSALVVSGLCGLAWLLRLDGLVSFISETILLGFKAGAALTIAMTQLPKLFGVAGGEGHFFVRAWTLLGQLGGTSFSVLGLGLLAILLLLLGERFLPGQPVALIVVALSILAMSISSLKEAGVATVGTLPSGLPTFQWPSLRARDVDGILPLSCACFLLAYIEGISAARTLAAKHDYAINPRQELLALGGANLAAAFGQGFPVAGGLSQSTVNDKAGAKTPMALVFASATLAACLLFLTDLLSNLPTVVLAAIVLVAVRGLIDVRGLNRLWQVSRFEFRIAMVALVGVLLLGILKGVLFAAIVSLLMLIAGAAHPHVAFLGRIPGTNRYSDLARHPDNEVLPGILIFRVEASLLYFNAEHVSRVVSESIQATPELRLVICDLSDSPMVDVAGGNLLARLQRELAKHQVQMRIVSAHGKVRDLLCALGLEHQVGYLGRHMSIEQAITESQSPQSMESV